MTKYILPAVGLIALIAISVFFPPFAILAFPLMVACLQKAGVVPK